MNAEFLKDKKVGIAMTGSFCTFRRLIPVFRMIKDAGAQIQFILSPVVAQSTTRFYENSQLLSDLKEITDKPIITTIVDAEPIGPQKMYDMLLVAPCTGNTIAKLANGITDTSVTLACKAHLRNQRPLVLFLSTNDALSMNAKNIGILLNVKNVYFVPFGQDDPIKKCNSLISDENLIFDTLKAAEHGIQIQPIIET